MRTPEQIRAAAEPFPPGLIESVQGKGDYVSWYHYAQRLLRQVGPYRWEVVSIIPNLEDGWIVHGRLWLSPDGEAYDGIGEDEAYIDKAGKLHHGRPKDAESDAYKRACSKAGFGLHLWAGKDYWLAKSLEREEGAE